MGASEPDPPPPRTYKDVPFVPSVDPDDLKRVWNVKPPWEADSHEKACSSQANVHAVVKRRFMIDTLTRRKLLDPWTHDGQLDNAVFCLAATFPLHEELSIAYIIPGDELFPFDPNAFVQRLVEETGVAHVWEPIAAKVAEGGRRYGMTLAVLSGSVPDPDREARDKTRQLLGIVWERFTGLEREGLPRESELSLRTVLFADFLIANADLVQQVVEAYRQHDYVGKDLLMEIERRAVRR